MMYMNVLQLNKIVIGKNLWFVFIQKLRNIVNIKDEVIY